MRDHILDSNMIQVNKFILMKAPNGKPMLVKTTSIMNNKSIFNIYVLEYGTPFTNDKSKSWFLDKYILTSNDKLKDDGNIVVSTRLAKQILADSKIKINSMPGSHDNTAGIDKLEYTIGTAK